MGTYLELFITFAKIGMFTFGGGYAMISLIEHECVEEKRWITADELMDITVIAESTPGPVAINCATYTGYKRAGMKGAVAATVGMVIPSFLILLLISSFMDSLLEYEIVAKAFRGIRVAVGFLIAKVGINMVRKLLKTASHRYISAGFVMGFFLLVMICNLLQIGYSTIVLILTSGFLGFCIYSVIGRIKR
ncbi:MAG: chromate transporter [Acetatifactor sp.]